MGIEVKMKLSPAKTGALYMQNIKFEERIKELSEAIANFFAGDIEEEEVKKILCKENGNMEWCDNCDFCLTTRVSMVPGEPSTLVDANYCELGFWKDEL